MNDIQVSFVSRSALEALPLLHVLAMDRNRLTDESFQAPLGGMIAEIDFSNNFLQHVPVLNSAMTDLELRANAIKYVRAADLHAAPRLRTLDMSYNGLTRIENGAFDRLYDLERVDLNSHDFECDCLISDLKSFLTNDHVHEDALKSIMCANEQHR